MKCPHCLLQVKMSEHCNHMHAYDAPKQKGGRHAGKAIMLSSNVETCPNCHGVVVTVSFGSIDGAETYESLRAYPKFGPFPPPPPDVPASISCDYAEANEVLLISAKASAALSRRCLQNVLSAHGYINKNLVKQVEAAIAETDASKALPSSLRDNIDAIRNFGNFSAHPLTDITSMQVIEVEDGEAEWCLEILLSLFDHYYVAPALAAQKRAALNVKLTAAGKPPMK